MAQTYNKMKIDIKEPVTDIITAKQNDSNSRFLDVYLYDGGVPIDLTGHELRIYMLKPDGTEVFNNGVITEAASGRCQFELTDQALGAYGKLQCEITLWKNNVQILTTPTFDIFVVKSLRTNGSIESSNEYGALVVLYQNLYEAIDLMTTMVEQFGEPGEVADAASIETFWQMLEYLYGVNEVALKNASVSEVLERIGHSADREDAGTLFGVISTLNELFQKHYEYLTYNVETVTDVSNSGNVSVGKTDAKLLATINKTDDSEAIEIVVTNVYHANVNYSTTVYVVNSAGETLASNSNNGDGAYSTKPRTVKFKFYTEENETYKIYLKNPHSSDQAYYRDVIHTNFKHAKYISEDVGIIDDVKTTIVNLSNDEVLLTELPMLNRCEFDFIKDSRDVDVFTFNGVEYVRYVPSNCVMRVKY